MNKKYYFILIILFTLLFSCSPKINTNKTKNLDKVFKEVKKEKQIKEQEKINALIRKGEILEKIHQYNPYIKILNIYIPAKQNKNGTFYHSRVISVPLIFKPIKNKYLNPYAAEKILNNSKTNNTNKTNNKNNQNTNKNINNNETIYKKKTGSTEIIMK